MLDARGRNSSRPRATSMHARKLQLNVWRSWKSCTKIAKFGLVLAFLQTTSKNEINGICSFSFTDLNLLDDHEDGDGEGDDDEEDGDEGDQPGHAAAATALVVGRGGRGGDHHWLLPRRLLLRLVDLDGGAHGGGRSVLERFVDTYWTVEENSLHSVSTPVIGISDELDTVVYY